MRVPIQKAVTNPLRILGVPYGLAMVNFIVFFILFAVSLIISMGEMNPLFFIIPFVISHYVLAYISKNEPQMGQILSSKLKIFLMRVPKNLIG
ncbi:MAG: VirB3 family type IV secretion system protein [Alphaproteobacteria bacterium]|nr:VirB3 family type IV secretion system protein [Alphaproteobacteria bacterium]